VNAVFIRAPTIQKIGKRIEVLAKLNGKAVLVRHKNVIAGTFHPETENDFFAHEMLLKMIR